MVMFLNRYFEKISFMTLLETCPQRAKTTTHAHTKKTQKNGLHDKTHGHSNGGHGNYIPLYFL